MTALEQEMMYLFNFLSENFCKKSFFYRVRKLNDFVILQLPFVFEMQDACETDVGLFFTVTSFSGCL